MELRGFLSCILIAYFLKTSSTLHCTYDYLKLQCSKDCCYTEGQCFPCNEIGTIQTHKNLSYLYHNWMTNLRENTYKEDLSLEDVFLPGIHHAGMIWSEVTELELIKNWTVTQVIKIHDELNGGVRFFDIRLGVHNGVLVSVHNSNYKDIRAFGVPIKDLMNDTVHFLRQNPGETVVWLMRWTYETPQWNMAIDILKEWSQYVVTTKNPKLLNETEGKVIVCANDDLGIYGALENCGGSWSVTDTPYPENLTTNIYNFAKTQPSIGEYRYLEAVCTPTFDLIVDGLFFGYPSLRVLAEYCNYSIRNQLLPLFMSQSKLKALFGYNRAMFIDFSNSLYMNQIVNFNFDLLVKPQLSTRITENTSVVVQNSEVTIIRPQFTDSHYCFLGDTTKEAYDHFNISASLLLKTNNVENVYSAKDYTLVTADNGIYYWQPNCKNFYSTLGMTVTSSKEKPMNLTTCCIHQSFLASGNWYAPNSKFNPDLQVNVPISNDYAFLTPTISIGIDKSVDFSYSIRKSVVQTTW